MKGKNGKKAVVNSENTDRKLVYEAIAKKQGTTADLVGQRRALQIAEESQSRGVASKSRRYLA